MATGETKLSYLDVVDDIQDGDTVPILRDGKNYMSTGLAGLNADLTDKLRTPHYNAIAQIGLSTPCSTADIVNALRQKAPAHIWINSTSGSTNITDAPTSGGILHIYMGSSVTSTYRGLIENYRCATNASGFKMEYYVGSIDSGYTAVTWYKVGLTAVDTTSLKSVEPSEEEYIAP